MTSRIGSAHSPRSIERLKRLDDIEERLLDGETSAEIQKAILSGPQPHPKHRQLKRDIREVWARIRARYEAEAADNAPQIRSTWERLVRKAERSGDLKAAVVAHAHLTKMLGLYAPTKLEVSGSVQVGVNVQVRGIIGVLSPRGLEAMRVLHEEIEVARVAGKLPQIAAGPAVEDDADDEESDPTPAGPGAN